jgi:hypothetical protein
MVNETGSSGPRLRLEKLSGGTRRIPVSKFLGPGFLMTR